jgi:hypothetical protein
VVLTPTSEPATSQSFSWLSESHAEVTERVQWRLEEGGVITAADAHVTGTHPDGRGRHHSATVSSLRPATTYQYRVGSAGAWSPWWEFTTAGTADTAFQFVYYGDAQMGLDSTWPAVVRMADRVAPRSIGSVHAGDLVNSGDDDAQWIDWFSAMEDAAATTNILVAPGNHEYVGDAALTEWKSSFENPRNHPVASSGGSLGPKGSAIDRQYAAYLEHWEAFATETVFFVDYQGVRFITLNATQDESLLTPTDLPACQEQGCPSRKVGELWIRFQADWLESVLRASTATWDVVTFHQPVYSASVGRDEPVLRKAWVPIFEEFDVDLVMRGHDHVYARGFNNADRTQFEGVTSGPVYIVANSGAKHYELAAPQDDVWARTGATQVRRGAGVTTFQVIDVSEDRLSYRAYLAESARTATGRSVGSVYDEFTITESDGRKWVTEAGVDPPTQ